MQRKRRLANAVSAALLGGRHSATSSSHMNQEVVPDSEEEREHHEDLRIGYDGPQDDDLDDSEFLPPSQLVDPSPSQMDDLPPPLQLDNWVSTTSCLI